MKKNSLTANILLALISTICLLGLTELALRYTGIYKSYMEKMGFPYMSLYKVQEKNWYHVHSINSLFVDGDQEFSYKDTTNNEGLVDKRFDTSKAQGTIRIMVFGDSFIQGVGAPYDSSCPRLLAAILNRRFHGNPKVEVWDCGVSGSDPFFEYILLANRLMQYKPDMVIEAVNNSDIDDIIVRGGAERFLPDSTVTYKKAPWFEPFFIKSHFVRGAVHGVFKYNWLFLRSKEMARAKDESLRQIEFSLKQFQNLCTEKHVPLLVALQPIVEELNGKRSSYDLGPLVRFCDSTGIDQVDVKQYLEKEGYTGDKANAIYWPINVHFNSEGYNRYAQCLSIPVGQYLDSIAKSK
jgi:lysophospholipase L1-like esterase